METTNEENIWSPATYRLKDIIDRIPTLVRVAEGIYGDNESTCFSQGDLIRLDSCAPLHRISAYLAQPGRITRYETFGNEISLPYNYNGRVRVQPMHGEGHEYLTVLELIVYFPRYVRIQRKVSFQYPLECDQTLEEGDVLTLKAVQRNKMGVTNSLRCTRFGKEVILPRDLNGRFLVLPDEEEQTIRTVVETYKLPQCVRFIGRGVKEIMSKDLQEAVDNMAAFSGEMIINGKTTSPPVLFGHYKGVGRATSTLICRRAAIVIPLHSPQVEDMEVQLAVRKHSDNYEEFLLKVFPAKSEDSSILEDALYADFSTTSNIQFLSSEVQTDDPPQEESELDSSSTSNSPPPLPPRRASDKHIPGDSNKSHSLPTVKVAPFSQAKQKASIPQEGEMSKTWDKLSVKPNSTASSVNLNSQLPALKPPPPLVEDGSQTTLNNPVQLAPQDYLVQPAPQDCLVQPEPQDYLVQPPTLPKRYSLPTLPFAEEENGYDIPEEDEMDEAIDEKSECPGVKAKSTTYKKNSKLKKGFLRFCRNVNKPANTLIQKLKNDHPNPDRDFDYIRTNNVPVSELSISELHMVLSGCGMPDLARICSKEKIDGVLFIALTMDEMKDPPFGLSKWKIGKAEKIQNGWLPKK